MALPILPLIGNLVKGFTTLKKTTGKFSAAKKFVTGKKKYKKSGTGIEQGDGPNQQVGDDTKVAESIPKEKMVSGIKIPTYKPSNKTIETSGKTSFESVSQTLDKIKETTDSLVKVSESELDVEKDKQDALERRRDKQKADERERRLESKRKKISIPGIGLSAKAGSSIFDFFANILLGSLVVFLLNNVDKIENLFKTLKENFENPFKLMKSVIQGISIAFGKPIKSFFKGAFNVLKKSGSGIKNLVKRITPKLTRTFKKLGSSIVNTVKNIVKSTKNTVTRSAGSAIARSTARAASAGAGQAAARGGAKAAARGGAKAVPKPSGPKPAPKPKAGANRIFGQKGVKRLLKFRNVFKSAAVVGSLISLVIDLILDEPLDRAAVGAVGGLIGGVLGSMAGGALGFAVGSVVPIAGNLIGAGAGKLIGGILGSMVGETIAKDLYENFKNNLSQVNIGETAVADSMTWRNIFGVDEPWTPPEGGPSTPDYQPGQETPSYIPGATSTPSGGGAGGGASPSVGGARGNFGPHTLALLDAIAFAEGTFHQPNSGYNTHFAFDQTQDLSQHPAIIKSGGKYRSDAFGRYQFMSPTWRGLGGAVAAHDGKPAKSGMDMSPANQDKGAVQLILRRLGNAGIRASSASDLEKLLKDEGVSKRIAAALSGEWASFPNAVGQSAYGQPVKKLAKIQNFYNGRVGTQSSKSQQTPSQSTPQQSLQQNNQQSAQQKIAVLAYGTNEWGKSRSYIVSATKKLIKGLMDKGYTVIVVPPSDKLVVKNNPKGNVVIKAPYQGVTTAAAEMGCQIDYGVYAPFDLLGNYVHLTPTSARAIKNKYKPDIVVGDSNAALIRGGQSATAKDGAAYGQVSQMISNIPPTSTSPQQAQLRSTGQNLPGTIKKMGKTTGGKKGDTISGFPVTSGYGKRWGGTHGGIDIGTPVGTYVALSVDVEILYSTIQGGTGSGYGNVIDAWAPSLGLQFRLAHLSKRLVSQGQKVPAGVPLGITGGAKGDKGSGSSTGPHLHFEVDNVKGRPDYGGMGDPSPYIGYLILSSSAPSGESKPITGQVISQPAERQYTDIQRQAPYDQRQGGNNVIMVPAGGGQMRGGGGGSSGSMVMGSSTQAVLNSYYKSQLLGFLYKQG